MVQNNTVQCSEIKANWIDRSQLNCVIKGKIGHVEVTGRRGGRRKQLPYGLKETRGYWELKEEALDSTLWRTRYRRGYGPVVRQAGW